SKSPIPPSEMVSPQGNPFGRMPCRQGRLSACHAFLHSLCSSGNSPCRPHGSPSVPGAIRLAVDPDGAGRRCVHHVFGFIHFREIKPNRSILTSWLKPLDAGSQGWTVAEWFGRRQKGGPKGKWTRKPDAEARSFDALKAPLTLTELVSI